MDSRLRELRLKKGVSQHKMADICGISRSAYGQYEYGISSPNPTQLAAMAAFFGVSIGYLVGVEDDPTPNPVPQNPLHIALTPQDAKLLRAIYDDPAGADLMYDLNEEEIKLLLAFWKGLRAKSE